VQRPLHARPRPTLSQPRPAPHSLETEQSSSRHLRSENEKLAGDMRTLAQQLKQERAASNAVLAVRVGNSETAAESKHGDGAGEMGANGLTLASAASQILMLRREVKWLQKQWQTAKRDQDGTANREQLDSLQQALEEEKAKASAAAEAAAAAVAQRRLLLRQLGQQRAQWQAQQARMGRRSAAQAEAAALRVQLEQTHEALLTEQQQRRALQQRSAGRGRSAGGGSDGGGAFGGGGGGADDDGRAASGSGGRGVSALDDEAIFAQRLLTRELISLERGAEQSASSYAALVGAKSEMALRLAQADEDRAGLTLELSNLKERFAALSEDRDSMAARAGSLGPPPPGPPPPSQPPPPPPPEQKSGGFNMKFNAPKIEMPKVDFRLPGRKQQT